MSEWISVKDKTPDSHQLVIILRDTINPDLKIQIIKWHLSDEFDFKVTHWMPLPTPPKEQA